MRGISLSQNPDVIKNIILRSKMVSAMRALLDERGLVEVETPILCTHREDGPFSQFETEYYANGRTYFLSICPEDRLKRVCWLFENGVYEIARCFRQENGPQHLTEFAMLEVKQAHKTMDEQIELAFKLIQEVALKFEGKLQIRDIDFSCYDRVTFQEVMIKAIGVDVFKEDSHERLLRLLDSVSVTIRDRTSKWEVLDHAMDYFLKPALQKLTFIVDFPLELSTISRVDLGLNVAKRFNIILNGVEIGDGGEKIIGSEGYIHLYTQNAIYRRKNLGIEEYNDLCLDFFQDIDAAPPMAGFGIGIDRLISLILDCNLDEVLLYPANYEC